MEENKGLLYLLPRKEEDFIQKAIKGSEEMGRCKQVENKACLTKDKKVGEQALWHLLIGKETTFIRMEIKGSKKTGCCGQM